MFKTNSNVRTYRYVRTGGLLDNCRHHYINGMLFYIFSRTFETFWDRVFKKLSKYVRRVWYPYVIYHIPQIVYNCTRNPHICTEPEKYSWGIGFRYFLPDSVGILRMYWHFKKSPVCGSHRRFIATGESRFSTVNIPHLLMSTRCVEK